MDSTIGSHLPVGLAEVLVEVTADGVLFMDTCSFQESFFTRVNVRDIQRSGIIFSILFKVLFMTVFEVLKITFQRK